MPVIINPVTSNGLDPEWEPPYFIPGNHSDTQLEPDQTAWNGWELQNCIVKAG